MPSSEQAVVVSDAHLSKHTGDTATAFCRFLERVPDLASHLLINGDLFEFWFTYRSVIPREAYPTLAALTGVRKAGVRLTVSGGNHDRWGGSFWKNELDAEYFDEPYDLDLAGWTAWIAHGHGIVELDFAGRLMHRITGMPVTAKVFGALHPNLAFWMVRRLSLALSGRHGDKSAAKRAASAQASFAKGLLEDREELNLVVMGHTHREALETFTTNKWYLNPGAWVDGGRYALITSEGPKLQKHPPLLD